MDTVTTEAPKASASSAHSADGGFVNVSPGRLRDFGTKVYVAAGMPEADAWLVADTLVQNDLWNIQSHGVMRMGWYSARLKSGVCNPVAAPETVVDAGAIVVWDGKDAMGQVLTDRATEEAIRRASKHGIGAVSLRNSGHFRTAFYYTRKAALKGYICFLTTNASPAMAPWGGRQKTVGTNPWSWGAPAGDRPPMVMDIANTLVARGKIYLAKEKEVSIPDNWAMSKDGEKTTDPAVGIEGILLPMADHKGYGISVIMDMLSGVLAGGTFGAGVQGSYEATRRSGACQLVIALNIAAFQPLAEFEERMERLIVELKAVPRIKGIDEIFYPGELEDRADKENREKGLLLPKDAITALTKLAGEMGLTADLPF